MRGDLKNLIFALVGPKPQIVLRDAVSNVVEITQGADRCLVYDHPLPEHGLTWALLVQWWADVHLRESKRDVAGRHLWQRLNRSLDSDPEHLLFSTYTKRYGQDRMLLRCCLRCGCTTTRICVPNPGSGPGR